ncbi:MAG: hypothetical protein IJ804_10725 [Prevotella sp.]|nr:hypothetical protein [Prevotella sp.]
MLTAADASELKPSDIDFTITLPEAEPAITITARSYSRAYGEANPTFEYDVTGGTLTGTPTLTCSATTSSDVGEYNIVVTQGSVTNSNVTYVNGTLTITKATPTVTAPTAIEGTLTYSGTAQNLVNAGSTTGGEIQYALSAGGTYSTAIPQGIDAGNYTIYYKVVGGTNYNDVAEAGPVSKSIAKKALTITADAKSKVYGADDPALTYTSSGLVEGDAITGVLTRTEGENVGEYDITQGTLTAGDNYSISYAGAKLSISQKEATLAWSSTEFTYNGLEQKPTATVSNLVGNDQCTVTVSGATNAGDHTSTASALSNANYKLPEVKTQAFTIAKAPLTISCGTYTMRKGEALPTFIAEYSEFVNGENESVLATAPTLTTGATSESSRGDYDVVVAGAEAANYDIAYQNGKLTILENYTAGDGVVIEQGSDGYYVLTVDEGNGVPSVDINTAVLDAMLNANGGEFEVAELNYTRELDAPSGGTGDATIDGSVAKLYTTCLAEAPTTAANAKYYTLDAANSTTLTFIEVNSPEANTPYLVAVTSGSDLNESQNVTNVTLKKEADNSTEKDGFAFKGTLTGLSNGQAAAAGAYILQIGNVWGKVTTTHTNAYIPPFRAYIVATSASAPAILNGNLGDDTTGVQNIRTVDLNGTERWYDLNGKRIQKPTKGINLQNGRKIVVK